MAPEQLTNQLKTKARDLGFDLVGACPAVAPDGFERLQQWLSAGYAGQMHYLADRMDAYCHPRSVLDGVRSLLILGLGYRTAEPEDASPGSGLVSRYAWGSSDYHDIVHDKLKKLVAYHQELVPDAQCRGVVDTAPLLEREFARAAGLGWIGKNTMLINRQAGSWFFLAALLTDQELEYDAPYATDHCGTCRACLDACPTDAFPEAGLLDATRCVSYLTIEVREEIPHDLREGLGDLAFGCDICQEVCPWNRKAPQAQDSTFEPASGMNSLELTGLFQLSDDDFRERFRRTPLWRSKRRGLLRNAAIVLGNQRPEHAIEALALGLDDADPVVREACAWALGRYDNARCRAILNARNATDA